MRSMEATPSIGKGHEVDWDAQHRTDIQRDLMEMMGVDLSDKKLRDQQIQDWTTKYAAKFYDITDNDFGLQGALLSKDKTVYESALEEVRNRLLDQDQYE